MDGFYDILATTPRKDIRDVHRYKGSQVDRSSGVQASELCCTCTHLFMCGFLVIAHCFTLSQCTDEIRFCFVHKIFEDISDAFRGCSCKLHQHHWKKETGLLPTLLHLLCFLCHLYLLHLLANCISGGGRGKRDCCGPFLIDPTLPPPNSFAQPLSSSPSTKLPWKTWFISAEIRIGREMGILLEWN